ncbi:MAG: peptidylprolyl isomerase [Parvibaculales bacterium]
MKKSRLFLFMVVVMTFARSGLAAANTEVGGIAAIVNDQVISVYDVNQRTELFLVTSGIEKTPETIQQLRGQVLRSLVDEMMQIQAAKDAEIKIDQSEIDASIQRIARDFGGEVSAVAEFLQQNNISLKTLESQIAAEIAWSYFVQQRFSGRIRISQIEIEEAYNRAVETMSQSRFNYSEILLLSDSTDDEEKTINLAFEIVSQLRGGADFGVMARQFSNATSSAQGGRLGWVTETQLEDSVAEALRGINDGEISEPFRTNSGIQIIRRDGFQKSGGIDSNRNLYDLLLISFDSESETLAKSLLDTRENFKTCKQAEQDATLYGSTKTQRTGARPLGSFMPALKSILADLEAGEISPSVRTKDSVDLIVVCDRKDDQGRVVTRDQVENNIYQQRMSMMSRRHMRELRRDAVVEYR